MAGFDPKETGKRIKTLRDSHGLTQEGLAELLVSLGASRSTQKSTVSKWENGEVDNIANTTLYFLTVALHTNHKFLLFGPAGEPKPVATVVPLKRKKTAEGS